jgi:DNA-directed RNA polymerase I, II, and III subunit RPABC1
MNNDNEDKQLAEAERETTRLWRAWRTVKEMCLDRVRALKPSSMGSRREVIHILTQLQGYQISDDEVRITLDEFKAMYTDANGYPEYANASISYQSVLRRALILLP